MSDVSTGQFVDMQNLKTRDTWLKGGEELNEESLNLTNIYLGRARNLTLEWLEKMGQGDSKNSKPFQTKLLRRFVHAAAMIWSNPPTRRLTLDSIAMPDADPTVARLAKLYQRSKIDSYLKSADRWRTIHGQTILYASPPRDLRPDCVPLRIFWPHSVMRDANDEAQDDISCDNAVAFEVYRDPREIAKSIWHYWEQVGDDQWEAYRVYWNGELVDRDKSGLYPNGQVPFDGPAFTCVYDELPEGRAWVPIDATRTAFALSMNVVLNDILYLIKQEAHSVIGISGVTNQKDMPKRWGPGEMWGFEDPEVRMHALALNPKLAESIKISEHVASVFAAGEGLPGDYFLATRKYETGAAGKLRQLDLDARRQDQMQAGLDTEREVFDIVRKLNNVYALDYGQILHEEMDLTVELGRQWFPTDLGELQATYAFDMSIGACSILDYIQERYRFTRDQAIDFYERVQVDREAYPVRENPAALIAGRKNANGPGSATPTDPNAEDPTVQPDASSMNANRAASNEAGSVIGAAKKATAVLE